MPKTENVNVNVLELSKWGYKDDKGFVSLSKNLSESDKAKLVPGLSFTAEYYVADSGTRYLNKILTKIETPKAVTDITPPVDVERAKKYTPKAFTPKYSKDKAVDNSMSKEEWAAKDQRISRQGAIQAAVIALAPVVSLETLPDEAVKLATSMLSFVNGAK
jgi:hypothetical protein